MSNFVQLALDFLTGSGPVEPLPAPRARAPEADTTPAEPLSQVVQPSVWHHPRANRQVRLGACEVGYEFKRGKRRTIGLTVTPEGLTVRAPRWTPVGEVEAFIRQKSVWVLDKLRASRDRAGALDRARIVWADDCTFDYLGQGIRLRLDPTQSRAHALLPADGDQPPTLCLGLAQAATEAQIRDAAQAWLARQAKALFVQRLDHFAPQLGVTYRSLRLSSAGTRWGSASADGTIRLNWRLIHLSMEMIDYVVVHELSHLRHMDHSPQFWDVVASVLPDHGERRLALRHTVVPMGR